MPRCRESFRPRSLHLGAREWRRRPLVAGNSKYLVDVGAFSLELADDVDDGTVVRILGVRLRAGPALSASDRSPRLARRWLCPYRNGSRVMLGASAMSDKSAAFARPRTPPCACAGFDDVPSRHPTHPDGVDNIANRCQPSPLHWPRGHYRLRVTACKARIDRLEISDVRANDQFHTNASREIASPPRAAEGAVDPYLHLLAVSGHARRTRRARSTCCPTTSCLLRKTRRHLDRRRSSLGSDR